MKSRNIFLPVFTALALLSLAGCGSPPSYCECQYGLVQGMAKSFKEGMEKGQSMDTSDLEKMAKECEDAYSDMTAAEQIEALTTCDE